MIRRAALFATIALAGPATAFAQETTATTVEAQEHTVIAGETLWEIARGYYGSAFEWRRIHEANTEKVSNPHWIEPGQVLDIPGATIEMVAGQAENAFGRTIPRETSRPLGSQSARYAGERVPGRTIFYTPTATDINPQQAAAQMASTRPDAASLRRAIPSDVFYAAGWLVKEESIPEEVIGQAIELADEEEGRVDRLSILPFERVRVEIDGTLPEIGEQLLVVRVGRRIKNMGEVVIPTGILTVASHEAPGVVAVLDNEYDRVKLGDFVMPLPALTVGPGVVAQPTNSELTGEIIAFPINKEVQSLGDITFLSLGLGDGIRLGDEFQVYAADDMGWTGEAIARIQVVGVRANQSSARIVDIEAPVLQKGQRVRLVARMP